jgi:hypothetical protein
MNKEQLKKEFDKLIDYVGDKSNGFDRSIFSFYIKSYLQTIEEPESSDVNKKLTTEKEII